MDLFKTNPTAQQHNDLDDWYGLPFPTLDEGAPDDFDAQETGTSFFPDVTSWTTLPLDPLFDFDAVSPGRESFERVTLGSPEKVEATSPENVISSPSLTTVVADSPLSLDSSHSVNDDQSISGSSPAPPSKAGNDLRAPLGTRIARSVRSSRQHALSTASNELRAPPPSPIYLGTNSGPSLKRSLEGVIIEERGAKRTKLPDPVQHQQFQRTSSYPQQQPGFFVQASLQNCLLDGTLKWNDSSYDSAPAPLPQPQQQPMMHFQSHPTSHQLYPTTVTFSSGTGFLPQQPYAHFANQTFNQSFPATEMSLQNCLSSTTSFRNGQGLYGYASETYPQPPQQQIMHFPPSTYPQYYPGNFANEAFLNQPSPTPLNVQLPQQQPIQPHSNYHQLYSTFPNAAYSTETSNVQQNQNDSGIHHMPKEEFIEILDLFASIHPESVLKTGERYYIRNKGAFIDFAVDERERRHFLPVKRSSLVEKFQKSRNFFDKIAPGVYQIKKDN